jgi:hypothetical protein
MQKLLIALVCFGLGGAADHFFAPLEKTQTVELAAAKTAAFSAETGWDTCMAIHMAYQDSVAALNPEIAVEAAKRETPYLKQQLDRLTKDYLSRKGRE